MFIIENITDISLPIWTLWVRCAVWLIQANPIRSVWLILRVPSKKNCGKFKFFCGIVGVQILAFRMYGQKRGADSCSWDESWVSHMFYIVCRLYIVCTSSGHGSAFKQIIHFFSSSVELDYQVHVQLLPTLCNGLDWKSSEWKLKNKVGKV